MFRKSHLLATVLAFAAIGATTSAGAAEARPQLHAQAAIMPHCGPAIPRLAAALDEMLPTARLSAADLSKVRALRDLMQELAKDGKEGAARDAEEVAMGVLGYKKMWLRCGIGTFAWTNQVQDDKTGPHQ